MNIREHIRSIDTVKTAMNEIIYRQAEIFKETKDLADLVVIGIILRAFQGRTAWRIYRDGFSADRIPIPFVTDEKGLSRPFDCRTQHLKITYESIGRIISYLDPSQKIAPYRNRLYKNSEIKPLSDEQLSSILHKLPILLDQFGFTILDITDTSQDGIKNETLTIVC